MSTRGEFATQTAPAGGRPGRAPGARAAWRGRRDRCAAQRGEAGTWVPAGSRRGPGGVDAGTGLAFTGLAYLTLAGTLDSGSKPAQARGAASVAARVEPGAGEENEPPKASVEASRWPEAAGERLGRVGSFEGRQRQYLSNSGVISPSRLMN